VSVPMTTLLYRQITATRTCIIPTFHSGNNVSHAVVGSEADYNDAQFSILWRGRMRIACFLLCRDYKLCVCEIIHVLKFKKPEFSVNNLHTLSTVVNHHFGKYILY